MESLKDTRGSTVEVRLSRHRLPLVRPLRLGSTLLHERDVVIVRMIDAAGNEGWGEVAPLPAFSEESIEEAIRHARREARRAVASAELCDAGSPPSVRFGFDLARADLRADAAGIPLHESLGARKDDVDVGALLSGSAKEVLSRAAGLVSAGYRAMKLKVAVAGRADEIALIRLVRDMVGPSVELRLDANRGWSFEEAVEVSDAIREANVAYVEEPLRDFSRLGELVELTGMPIALDEGMRGAEGERESGLTVAVAGVIKPTLTGWAESFELAGELARRGVRPVLSSAFESGVGLRGLVAIAACEPLAASAAGIDTQGWLADDVLLPRLPLGGPSVLVRQVLGDSGTRLLPGEELTL